MCDACSTCCVEEIRNPYKIFIGKSEGNGLYVDGDRIQ
jgi:hypothetical protein